MSSADSFIEFYLLTTSFKYNSRESGGQALWENSKEKATFKTEKTKRLEWAKKQTSSGVQYWQWWTGWHCRNPIEMLWDQLTVRCVRSVWQASHIRQVLQEVGWEVRQTDSLNARDLQSCHCCMRRILSVRTLWSRRGSCEQVWFLIATVLYHVINVLTIHRDQSNVTLVDKKYPFICVTATFGQYSKLLPCGGEYLLPYLTFSLSYPVMSTPGIEAALRSDLSDHIRSRGQIIMV